LKTITSRDNPLFKHLSKLAQSSRARRKARQTLLDGVHLVGAYHEGIGLPVALAVSSAGLENSEIAALVARLLPLEAHIFAPALFNEIAPVHTPTGILALIDTPEPKPPPADMTFCVLLENIQDPGNLGSILRSAAAAGARHVVLSTGCAFAWAPRVVRAAMGAHFSVHIYEQQDLLAVIRHFSGRVVAAQVGAERSLYAADLTGPLALLIGNEGTGLSAVVLAEVSQRITIPMPGSGQSLNAAAAAAVCLFEKVRQESAAPGRRPPRPPGHKT
jgi:RNA methyltransferase, TrmH family